ncbi:hypothetical protein BLNAU_20515 [Blattamonas nauphoetae]|uniref:Right handed beta helix domain-containing protein n=1 Tax=Blattamonas nauphoetae TaxID=2049346 RepID=A0ABQ9X1R7_9EUKA|nr:hypothetical protein BLNAU_20515 [Blattamonas nauphoetae]
MFVVFVAAILTSVQPRPVDKISSLFPEDLKTLEGRMKNAGKAGIEMIYLSNAEMIARTIQVKSADVSLIGNNTIVEYNVEERRSEKNDESVGQKFMFSVWNSSFRVSGVRALCMSTESGLCVVSSSKVFLSLSAVISDGLHSPLVMRCSGDGMCGSSSWIVVSQCTHESPRHFVAPFVDVGHSRNDFEISGSENEREQIGGLEPLSVVGTGISMRSQTLWMGTGPLFSFGMASKKNRDFGSAFVGRMDTGMEFCSLVNMSSQTYGLGDFGKSGKGFGSVVQRIVGSSICLSSNHDRGTGMLDVNLGGSLRCVNTSFFSCVREGNPETEKSESFAEFVQNDRFFIDSTSPVTSVSYTLCSFNEMTAAVGNNLGGAAICLYQSSASLTIDQCFFHKCTVTADHDDGGAVFVRNSSDSGHPVAITNTAFTECKSVERTGNAAGGLIVTDSSQTTLDGCFFESCTAQYGGAAYFRNSPLTLSNCAFVLCSSSVEAGALHLFSITSIDSSFLQFRECKCPAIPASKDIYFIDVRSDIANSGTIKFCDSTSGSPNVYFETDEVEDSTLVPQLTEEQKTGISSFGVSMGEDTATITIRTTEEVKGTMGVLLEGSNVPRLVHVSFGTTDTKSSTGTVEVSIGLEGVLPFLSDEKSYTIRTASIPGWSIDASILSVSVELKGTSEASFELTGCLQKTGTYSMKVKDSENNNFTISLSLSSDLLTGTSPLSSTDSTKLKYEEEYEVVQVSCDSQPLILIASFSFSIPYPPATLTGIDQTDGNDSMAIGFVGTGFVASGYKVRVTEVGVEEPSTLTVDLLPSSESRLAEWTAKLYPFSEADLKYGTEYEVSSAVSLDGKQTVTTSSLTFETPVEPSRVTSVSFTRLCDSSKKAEVSVEGRAMSVVETYTLHLNETLTQTPAKMNVSFSSSTNGKGTALLFSLIEDETELNYNTNYTVVNVTDSSNDAVLFTSGLTFKTDIEPTRLVSFSIVGLDSGGKRVLFSMSGRALNSNEIYLVELSKSGKTRFTVEMKFVEGLGKWEGSGVVYPVLGAELGFGERLDVKSFREQGADTDLLFEANSLTISAEPSRLVSVKSSDEDGLNLTTLTVETRALEVGEEYTLTLSGTPLPSPSSSNAVDTRTIRFTATSETTYVFPLSLYPLSSAELLFGHTYSASWMAIGSNTSILIETPECSFSTPVEPERLVSVSAANFGSTSLNSTIELSFSSRALLPLTEYSLTFTSCGSQNQPPHSKTLKLTTTENGLLDCHVAVLYPLETEISKRDSQFEFERTYVLSSFERGSTELLFDTELVSLVIPKEPTRIEKCLKAELNKHRTAVRLFFEGRALDSAMGLIWLKDGSKYWTSVSSLTATDSTHCFADFSVLSSESEKSLEFGKEYTVGIKTSETVSFIVKDEIKARIPFPPRLLSASFAFTNTLLTSCSISFVGSHLPVGKDFRVTLSPSLSFVIGVIDAEHAESSRLRIGWPDSLEFSRNYTISSIVGLDEDDGVILFDPSLSFETKSGPSKLTLFVDFSSGSSEWFCGEESLPCSTIEAAWWIVDGIGVSKVTLDIVHNTTQSTPIVISKGMEVVVRAGQTTLSELFVSPLPTLEEWEGIISVTESSLWMNQVDVVITNSPFLTFVIVVNGTLTLQLCSIVGLTQSLTPTLNSEPFSCSWKSGAFVLKNSTTKLVSSSFSLLSSGAVWMEGGTLTVETSAFHDNSPHDALFPSARRNIDCSSGGRMMIGSLSGGDGTPTSPSPWISQNDCSLEGLESIRSAPLFIPTLSSSESSSEFSKQNKTFSMWIVGSTLIQCGLCLEVFEIVSSKSEKVGRAKSFDLSLESTDWKNETHISVSISSSSLSSLDSSLEWRGRLLFGSHSTLTSDSASESGSMRTSESFQIQSSISDRRSQSVKENMKWWLPLVISLCVLVLLLMIVVFVCWRRRGQAEKKKSSTPDPEPQEMEIEKVEDFDAPMPNTVDVSSARELNGNTRFEMRHEQKQTSRECKEAAVSLIPEKDRVEGLCAKEGKFETVVVNKTHTLYERLHVEKVGIDRRRVASMIVRGLMELSRQGRNGTGLGLSSHWVLFSESGEVCLRVKGEMEKSEFVEKVKSDVRWRSPEQKDGDEVDGGVDAEQVTVFRLGLVLYEIETGQVPFGETDEVNASRALHCGTIPKMEGVGDEMEKLIVSCLNLTAGSRPSLRTIGSVLGSIGKMDGGGTALTIVS